MCLVELIEFITKPGVLSSDELYMEFMHMVGGSARALNVSTKR